MKRENLTTLATQPSAMVKSESQMYQPWLFYCLGFFNFAIKRQTKNERSMFNLKGKGRKGEGWERMSGVCRCALHLRAAPRSILPVKLWYTTQPSSGLPYLPSVSPAYDAFTGLDDSQIKANSQFCQVLGRRSSAKVVGHCFNQAALSDWRRGAAPSSEQSPQLFGRSLTHRNYVRQSQLGVSAL